MGYTLSFNKRFFAQDESVPLGSFTTINFLGAGVSAVNAGNGVVNVTIGAGASGWLLDGNTVVSEKYIGTNDAFDFPIYTNGTRRITVKSTGFTGFNTTSPNTLVHMLDAASATDRDVLTIGTLGTGTPPPPTSRRTAMMYDVFVSGAPANCIRTYAIYDNTTTDTARFTIQTQNIVGTFVDTLNAKNEKIGIGTTSPNARFHSISKFSTSATFNILTENSLNVRSLRVRDDGSVWSSGANDDLNSTAFGEGSLSAATTAIYNTAFGKNALTTSTIGSVNVAVGTDSLRRLTQGNNNIGVGFQAGGFITTGEENVAVGRDSLASITTTNRNTAVGYQSAYAATSAGTCAFGYRSLYSATGINTAFGYESLLNTTSGTNSTAIGYQAGYSATTVSNGVYVGYQAGIYETAGNKLFIDSLNRTNEATGRTNSLIYGIFDAAVANQYLHINAEHINVDDLPVGRTTVNAGELYVDTAANILAAGDYVVARKV